MRAKLPTVTIALLLTLLVIIVILHNGQVDAGAVEYAPNRKQRSYCDPNMCAHLQDKYFDKDSCSCKPCCYSTIRQVANNEFVPECREKNKKRCIDHPKFSACSINGIQEELAQCPSDPDTPSCKEGCHEVHGYCNMTGECSCHTGWQGTLCDTCVPKLGCDHGRCETPGQCICYQGWKGVLCDQVNTTSTTPLPLPLSSIQESSPSDGKNITSNPHSESVKRDFAAIIIGAPIGSVAIVVFVSCCCYNCYKRCGKNKDNSSNEDSSTPTSGQSPGYRECEGLLGNSSSCSKEPNEQMHEGRSVCRRNDEEQLHGQTFELASRGDGDNTQVSLLNETQDSAYFSFPASPRRQPSISVASFTSSISTFAWEVINELHAELKESCVSTEDWERALQAEAINGYQVKLNGVSAEVLAAHPSCIITAFTDMTYGAQSGAGEDVVPLLCLIKRCQRFHYSADTPLQEVDEAVDKVINVIAEAEDVALLQGNHPHMLYLLNEFCGHPNFPKDLQLATSDMANDKVDPDKKKFFSQLEHEVKNMAGRLTTLEDIVKCPPTGPEEPVVRCIPLFNMVLVFIDWKIEGYKNRCWYQLVCNHKTCVSCRLNPAESLPSTPMALSVCNLEANHTFILRAKLGMFEEEEYVLKTLGKKCRQTFDDLTASAEYMDKLSIQCDQRGCDFFRKRMAGLLQCSNEYERMEYYKDYKTRRVISMLLEKQKDFPIAVLIYCLLHCGMYAAIDELSEWHGRCDVCGSLYRDAQKYLTYERF